MLYSIYNKTKTKTYINILKHSSLEIDLTNMYRRFQACKFHNNGDIHVKKILMEMVYFLFTDNIMQYSFGLFQCKICQWKGFIICF